MDKRIQALLFLLVVSALLVYWYMAPVKSSDVEAPDADTIQSPQILETIAIEQELPPDVTEAAPDSSNPHPSTPPASTLSGRDCLSKSDLWLSTVSARERGQLNEWLESEGFPGNLDRFLNGNSLNIDESATLRFDDYASYPTETLRELADSSDDDKALLTLADRLRRERAYEEARARYREAVIRGYTSPLLVLNRIPDGTVEKARERDRDELSIEMSTDFIARLFVYQRRNGPGAEFRLAMSRAIMTSMNGEVYGPEAVDSLFEAARDRADRLYEEFEAERRARGLPPFDNTQPPIARRFERDMALVTQALESGTPECGQR